MSFLQYAVQVTMSNIVRSICLPPMSESCRRLSCVELFCSELFGQLHKAVRVLWENESHYTRRAEYVGLYYIMCHFYYYAVGKYIMLRVIEMEIFHDDRPEKLFTRTADIFILHLWISDEKPHPIRLVQLTSRACSEPSKGLGICTLYQQFNRPNRTQSKSVKIYQPAAVLRANFDTEHSHPPKGSA